MTLKDALNQASLDQKVRRSGKSDYVVKTASCLTEEEIEQEYEYGVEYVSSSNQSVKGGTVVRFSAPSITVLDTFAEELLADDWVLDVGPTGPTGPTWQE